MFVKVSNHEYGEQYIWDIEKFVDWLDVIWELVNEYFETDVIPQMRGGDDPFYDKPEPQLIG